MSTQRIDGGNVASIEIDVSGDLSVAGGAGNEIIVISDDDHQEERSVVLADGALRIRVQGDARVRLPRHIPIGVERVGGDARLRDLGAGVTIDGTAGDLRIEDVQGVVTVNAVQGDLTVQRVQGAVSCHSVSGDLNATEVNGDLAIGQVRGDVRGDHVNGGVTISEPVSGDLKLTQVGGVTTADIEGDLDVSGCQNARIGDVSGDVAVRAVVNDVVFGQVSGDAVFDNCAGPVTCGEIGGDLTVRDLRGGLHVDQIGGRAKLSTSFAPGHTYDVTAGGGATIVLVGNLQEASVSFDLRRTDGGGIDVRLPLQDLMQEPGTVRGKLGLGEATVRVESNGGLRLVGSERDNRSEPFTEGIFEGIGEEIQSAFSAFMGGGNFDFDFEQRLRDNAERVRQQAEDSARRTSEQTEQRVREATRRAAESVERQVRRVTDRVQRGAERASRGGDRPGWGVWHGQPFGGGQPFGTWPQPPPPPAPPTPPARPRATEEERLAVLRLLSEGKVTAEDAARLLEALGA